MHKQINILQPDEAVVAFIEGRKSFSSSKRKLCCSSHDFVGVMKSFILDFEIEF